MAYDFIKIFLFFVQLKYIMDYLLLADWLILVCILLKYMVLTYYNLYILLIRIVILRICFHLVCYLVYEHKLL